MPLSTAAHDTMLTHLTGLGVKVQLLKAIKLDAAAANTATTVTLDTSVSVGDFISLNNAAGDRETFEVVGSPGLTPTLDHALVYDYADGDDVGWAPKGSSGLILADAAAQTITWGTASGEVVTNTGTAPEFDVGTNNTIGSFALYNSAETVYYGSFLTNNIESFGAAGTYVLTVASVTLES
jgi:hypothetical protein